MNWNQASKKGRWLRSQRTGARQFDLHHSESTFQGAAISPDGKAVIGEVGDATGPSLKGGFLVEDDFGNGGDRFEMAEMVIALEEVVRGLDRFCSIRDRVVGWDLCTCPEDSLFYSPFLNAVFSDPRS